MACVAAVGPTRGAVPVPQYPKGQSRGERELGQGIVEVLVALLILGMVSTAFLGLSGAFMRGSLSARQREAAVRCAQHVVEQVRAGGGTLPRPGSCGDSIFPDLEYELDASESGDWMVTVSVYDRRRGEGPPIYEVTTARYLGANPP